MQALAPPAQGTRQYGYGDTEVGAKHRFIQETDVSPQVGFFPLLAIPTGSAHRGLGSEQVARRGEYTAAIERT